MQIPDSPAGGTPRDFRLTRSKDGLLRLLAGAAALPVSGAYLEHLAEQGGLAVCPGQERTVDSALAVDALEEALAGVGHSIVSAEALKRRLLFFLRLAEGAQAPDAGSEAA